ncbi:hypothetical protein Fmac_032904 [Flemingia macrophylla]|uniref:Uncharacterized protein n=1 Tax=Flemingia macrophylla TaxID=520843 RepID=A0ABD1L6N5_9FABA
MRPLLLEEFMMWLQEHRLKLERLERKLDALVNLVTQLAVNQKPASVARVCGIRSSNDHHTNLEGKLAALVNLVTQLAANQKPASVATLCGIRSSNDHHTREFSARNDAIVIRGVHDVATDTSAETRKLEGKLDAFEKLVTQVAANQKPASVASVCGIRSSNDHHTSVCPSSQQSGVHEHFNAYAANTYSRPPQQQRQGVHDVATDTSVETRKLEGKLDALVHLVTQLAANQKPASFVRFCDIRSSDDHHTSICPSSHQSGVDEHPDAYAANTYSRPPQQQTQGT